MAQRKYTSAAKGRGFNAVTVSNANIQQMSAESNRIVEGMRARRDSDLENQRRILQDMESNAAYSERTRKRDFDIASTNLDTQRQQQQYNAEATQARIRQETELGTKIFDSIASFSATAAQKSQELRKEKDKKDFEAGILDASVTSGQYTPKDLQFLADLNEQDRLSTLLDNNAALAKERGFDSNAVAKLMNMSVKQRAGYFYGAYQTQTKIGFSQFRQEQITNPEKKIGGVSYLEAQNNSSLTSAMNAEILSDWISSRGYPQNHEMLKGVYIEAKKINDAALIVSINNETEFLNSDTLRKHNNAAFSNFSRYGGEAFVAHKNIKGNIPAHENYYRQATAMSPDGTFVLSDADWQNTDVNFVRDANGKITKKGFKGTYLQDYPTRSLEIQNAREDLRRSWATNQRTTERNDYQAESAAWWQEYQNNPTPETLAAAQESFKDNQQGNPEWLTKAKAALDPLNAPYIQQLKTQAKDLQARGMLNQPFINEVMRSLPQLAVELQKSKDDQNPFLKNETYVGQRKVVGKITKRPTVTNPNPKDTADSFIAARAFQREFDAYVKANAAADGIEKASDDAATMLQDKVAKARDPKDKYYGKYNPVTGLVEFPNIRKDENLTGSEAAKEQAQQVQDALNDGRQQEIINKKYGVLTQTELETEIKNINKPGYVPNVKLFLASKGLSGGVLSLLNKQLVLAGMDPIEPPESLARVGEYSPSAQKLLQRYLNNNVATRVHGYEGNKLGNEWNRHVSPAEYRDMIDTHSKTYGVPPALIAAGLEVESGFSNQTSSAGAKGMAQFMDATAAQYGVDVNDPDSSIKGMAAYMKDLIDQFGDPILAAGAYNAGPGRMQEYVQNNTPLPAETVNHMRKVTKALYKYSSDPRLLQRPELIRQGMMPAGSVVPYQRDTLPSTGDHLDTRILVKSGPNKGQRIDPMSRPDLLSKVYIGDNVDNAVPLTSFEVTSPYGDRVPPAPGASSFHAGIDSAIASGKKIFVKDGEGFYREKSANVVPITDDDGNTFEFEFYHTEK